MNSLTSTPVPTIPVELVNQAEANGPDGVSILALILSIISIVVTAIIARASMRKTDADWVRDQKMLVYSKLFNQVTEALAALEYAEVKDLTGSEVIPSQHIKVKYEQCRGMRATSTSMYFIAEESVVSAADEFIEQFSQYEARHINLTYQADSLKEALKQDMLGTAERMTYPERAKLIWQLLVSRKAEAEGDPR